MDLTIFDGFDNLNEFNMHLQGENQLTCAMFQTITVFEIKLELQQVQVMTKNFVHFDALDKHSAVNSKIMQN